MVLRASLVRAVGARFWRSKITSVTPEQLRAHATLLHEHVIDLVYKECRRVAQKICDENGWHFSSAWSTDFLEKVPESHPARFKRGDHFWVSRAWPPEFKEVFDWATSFNRLDFPDLHLDPS